MSMDPPIAAGAAPSSPAPVPESPFTIGDMARAFNVSPRTLSFYEDRGLLTPRRAGSARLCTAQDRRRLELILRGKRLGFALTEIVGFMADNGLGPSALALDAGQIATQIAHLERQREGLEAAIAELRAAKEKLDRP